MDRPPDVRPDRLERAAGVALEAGGVPGPAAAHQQQRGDERVEPGGGGGFDRDAVGGKNTRGSRFFGWRVFVFCLALQGKQEEHGRQTLVL